MLLLEENQMRTVRRFLELLAARRALLVLTHTNPDPDAMASGAALCHLARERAGLKAVLAYTGDIFRAENKEMVRVLGLDLHPLAKVDPGGFDAFALVDSQPAFGHTRVPEGVRLDLVVDHHVPPAEGRIEAVLTDIRTDVGSTSSILTEYLREAETTLPAALATALFYGIRTDTADLSRNLSATDDEAYRFLLPRVDRKLLRQVTYPSLKVAYYRALRQALGAARIQGSLVVTSLGRTDNPELVAEVADLLMRLDGIDWAVCGGLHDGTYYLSVRAAEGKDAYLLLRDVLQGEGSGGGHGTVAGGRIPLVDDSDRGLRRLQVRLFKSLLETLGERGKTPVRLGG